MECSVIKFSQGEHGMTLHLDLLAAESAEAFLVRDTCGRKETPASPAIKPEPAAPAPETEAPAGTWGY